jgi:RNA:NAD 2'-phosphotransferase (TPT1/KptA family)
MSIEMRLLSKTVSRVLRHEPWIYELELDEVRCLGFFGQCSVLFWVVQENHPYGKTDIQKECLNRQP